MNKHNETFYIWIFDIFDTKFFLDQVTNKMLQITNKILQNDLVSFTQLMYKWETKSPHNSPIEILNAE